MGGLNPQLLLRDRAIETLVHLSFINALWLWLLLGLNLGLTLSLCSDLRLQGGSLRSCWLREDSFQVAVNRLRHLLDRRSWNNIPHFGLYLFQNRLYTLLNCRLQIRENLLKCGIAGEWHNTCDQGLCSGTDSWGLV